MTRNSGSGSVVYPYDVAMSAVPYDAAFVEELSSLLTSRLVASATWAGRTRSPDEIIGDGDHSPLDAASSRLAVVLHQRLWCHDAATRRDDVILRERLRARPKSIRVITLDDQPLPRWLESAPRCDLATAGIEGVVEFLASAVASTGGSVRPAVVVEELPPAAARTWPEGPPPFLAQPRAFSTLRRELDALAAELKPRTPSKQEVPDGPAVELHALPNRLVLRVDAVGVSFSWVSGRHGTVADGRLLVIQWEGATAQKRGAATLASATPVRERVYRAESSGPDAWCWRADDPNGRSCSTSNLAAEWLAAAAMATADAPPARAAV